ncbi:MAG: GGDEF domain-containing protein [Rhodospirillaceae bacterium]|nr:GGDEF domain-containing protein [Rhodospirillaceae bacterium]
MKLFLTVFLLVFVICVGVYEIRRQDNLAQIEIRETATVTTQVSAIADILHRIRADLLILSRQSELATATPGSPSLDALAQEYAQFARAISHYESIFLMDPQGRPLIEVEDIGGEISFTVHTKRTDSPASNISALTMLSPGGMLMSTGAHPSDTSPRPHLHFAIAAMSSSRKISHIIEVTYRTDVLLDQLAQISVHSPHTLIVANTAGYWETQPQVSPLSWNFVSQEEAKSSIPQQYPKAWSRILGEENGVIRVKDGIFIFRTAHPAIKGFWGMKTPTDTVPSPDATEWKIISFVSPQAIAHVEDTILSSLIPFALASLLSLGLGSWIFAMLWSERHHRHSRLLYQATTDPLTGAFNRAAFNERLNDAAQRYEISGEGYALIYVDLDDFKDINDIHGHEAGDTCLQNTVARIRSCIRDSDAIGRLGGDEFAIILSPCKSRAAGVAVFGKIAHTLGSALPDGNPIQASMGLAVCPDDGTERELLLRVADQAMYAAKRMRHPSPCP